MLKDAVELAKTIVLTEKQGYKQTAERLESLDRRLKQVHEITGIPRVEIADEQKAIENCYLRHVEALLTVLIEDTELKKKQKKSKLVAIEASVKNKCSVQNMCPLYSQAQTKIKAMDDLDLS